MTASEQALVELRTRLEGVLEVEEAATLMDHLPSERAATRGDLHVLEKRLDERIDSRSQILEYRISGALSEVREDFARQMNIQTRITVFSTISALLALTALTPALAGT